MSFKSATSKVLLGFILAFFALAAFLFWLADPLNLKAPRDRNLIAFFHDHRVAFDKLRDMAAADRQEVSYISESDIEGKISDARKQEYRSLLSKIYPCLKVVVDYDTSMRFVFAEGGLSAISSGWLKGIEYVPDDHQRKGKIVQDLDEANSLPPGVYLREIESNWLVVYQRTSD